jgi:hypothetical protein
MMPQPAQGAQSGSQKVSTGMLLNRIPSEERRFVARELHESLRDLPNVWAPAEVFVHESISYRLHGRAFIHMAPPLSSERVEIHILEGLYALPTLRELARELPPAAMATVLEQAPHRHTSGGELTFCVTRENFREVFQFILRLYRRERGY